MENWKFICKNGLWKTVAESCYESTYFPIEVRGILADWLDEQIRSGILDLDPLGYQVHITGFVRTMVQELSQRIRMLQVQTDRDYFYKCRLEEIVKGLQELSQTCPSEVFMRIKTNLQKEASFINSHNVNGTPQAASPEFPGVGTLFSASIDNCKIKSKELDCSILQCSNSLHEFRRYEALEQQFHISPQECGMPLLEIQKHKHFYQSQLGDFPQKMQKFLMEIQTLKLSLYNAYQTADKELKEFKNEQRLVALGKTPERDLEIIDQWYSGITDCFVTLRQSLSVFEQLCQFVDTAVCNQVNGIKREIEFWQREMVATSLVVETQPNQIIRTDTKFGPVRLRVLACSPTMTIVDDRTSVIKQTKLINDVEAAELTRKKITDVNFIPDSTRKLDVVTKGYPRIERNKIEFKDFKVNNPQRGTRKGEKNVTEELYYIYFQVTVNIEGAAFKLWVTTLPIVITSHPTQDGYAWATILWDNALPQSKRKPLSQVPDSLVPDVSWRDLINLIDLLFVKAGRGLSEDSKYYLKTKLFRQSPPDNEMVSYKQFCKDRFVAVNVKLLSKRPPASEIFEECKTFTFWMWVWSFLELLNWKPEDSQLLEVKSLKYLWENGHILGFLSETEIIEKLSSSLNQFPNQYPFIIRFPEGRPESIGVYSLNVDSLPGKKELTKLSYTIKDLNKLPLHNRILDNIRVTHLYPNIPKEDIFSKTNRSAKIAGYYILGLKEYWSERSLPEHLDQGANRRPSNQSTSYSCRSFLSEEAASPSSSTQSEYSINDLGNTSGKKQYEGECSIVSFYENCFDYFPHHNTTMEINTLLGISRWAQDGIAPSITHFE